MATNEKNELPLEKTGFSEENYIRISMLVANKLSKKRIYLFSGFEKEDCYQQALLYCLELRDKFDAERGSLENWLSRSVKRLLLNHRRDYFLRENDPNKSAKLALLTPVGMEHDERSYQHSDAAIILAEIDEKLPAELREWWLRFRDGQCIGHQKRKVLAAILDIVSGGHFDKQVLTNMSTSEIQEEIRWIFRD